MIRVFRLSGFVIRASSFFRVCPRLTSGIVSDSIEPVKWFALFALLALECSCTTLPNRRDLYSPQPDPGLDWHRQIPTASRAEAPANSPVNR
jgi:hypothetical protein